MKKGHGNIHDRIACTVKLRAAIISLVVYIAEGIYSRATVNNNYCKGVSCLGMHYVYIQDQNPTHASCLYVQIHVCSYPDMVSLLALLQ